jgi:hypothetical protein
MAKKHTLASKVGASSAEMSAKIEKVREEDPGLTSRQAAGKAAGILAGRHGKKFKGKKK